MTERLAIHEAKSPIPQRFRANVICPGEYTSFKFFPPLIVEFYDGGRISEVHSYHHYEASLMYLEMRMWAQFGTRTLEGGHGVTNSKLQRPAPSQA